MKDSKQKVVAIAFITAAAVLGDSMLFIVLPLYYQEVGLTSLWQVGVLLSVNRLIRLPFNPIIGWLYSKFQLRTGVLIAVLLAAATTLSYGLVHIFWVFVVMRVLWGVAWSLLRLGGMLTVVEVSTSENRGKLMGLYNGLWGIGGLLGMLAGGFLVDVWGLSIIAIIFAAIAALMLPVAYYFVPINTKHEQEKRIVNREEGWLTNETLLVFATGMTMGFAVFGIFASTLSTLVERSYLEEWVIAGTLVGSAALAGSLQSVRWGWDPFVAPLIGKVLDQTKRPHYWILLPLFSMSICFLLFQIQESIFLLLAIILLFQLMSTFLVTATDTLAAQAASQNPIAIMTVHTVVVDLGAALGPLVAFFVIDHYGIFSVYGIASAIMGGLGCMWLLFIVCGNKRKLLWKGFLRSF